MNNNTLTLTIRANIAALKSALKSAQSSIKNFASSAGSKLASTSGDLQAAFKGASSAIETTLKRVGAAAIGSSFGLAAFVKSASELQSLRASFQSLTGTIESTNSVMNTLYQYGKETAFDNKSIQASAKMFLANGVAVQDLMGWMRNLGDVAGATGADLQGLVLPITQAIGTGKVTTQDWYQIINQGAGGLQKYIIMALGAGHSTKTFKDDLEKGRVTVDVMRKALEMASAEGGMAFEGALKQSQTFNGRLSNLKETITNVGLSIIGVDAATGEVKAGGVFDRISKAVEDATKWLEDNKETVLKVANVIIDNLVPALAALGAAWAIIKIGQVAAGFVHFISLVKNGTKAMAAFNTVVGMNPLTLIVIAIAAVVAALVYLQLKFDIFGKAAEWIKNVWSGAVNAVAGFLSALWDKVVGAFNSVKDGVVGAFNHIREKIAAAFAAIGQFFIDVFNGIVSFLREWGLTILAIIFFPISILVGLFFMFKDQIFAVFSAIGRFISDVFAYAWSAISAVWGVVVGFFASVWNGIVAIFSAVIGFYVNIFQTAWNGIVAVWNVVVGFFAGIWNGIVAVFSAVGNWFAGIFQGAWDGIKRVFSGVGSFFRGVWDTIVGIFSRVGTAIADTIGGAVKGVVNSVLGFAENAINGFIRAINIAIEVINAIPGVKIGKLSELNIPRLATGGIVSPQGGGSIIYAGDGGQNEWVVPESKMASLVRQINARGGVGAGFGDVNITVNVEAGGERFSESDAVDIAQKINRALKAQGLRLDQMGALR